MLWHRFWCKGSNHSDHLFDHPLQPLHRTVPNRTDHHYKIEVEMRQPHLNMKIVCQQCARLHSNHVLMCHLRYQHMLIPYVQRLDCLQ